MESHVHGRPLPFDSIERVRHRLLSDLHLGRLAPGDRVPSVRRLADLTGLNRKTVHRAYARLAKEGLLEPRPGSGTFISRDLDASPTSIEALLDVAEACGSAAHALGLPPERLTRFLEIFHGDRVGEVPLLATECNLEQLGLMRLDLERTLGLRIETVPLDRLHRDPDGLAGRGIVTTDCHHAEVAGLAGGRGARVYRVALDRDYPRAMLRLARRGRLVVVVTDDRFGAVFARLLRSLGAGEDVVDNVRVVTPADLLAGSADLADTSSLHVSPLIDADRLGLPDRLRPIRRPWRVDEASRDRLKASLALDLALGRLPRREESRRSSRAS